MTECFAYLRVSGKGQTKGDGFRRQFIAIRKYCKANDLQIIRVFKERGITGKSDLEDRPALSELFAALDANGTRTVVIEKLDRLARFLMVQETIIADMRKKGYTLLSAYEPDLCSDDPSRTFMRQIFGAIAQYDAAITVLKLRGARERIRARDSKCEGRKAFGERPDERQTLEQIREWSYAGSSATKIAADLNSCGFKSRSGRPWRSSVISKILRRNPCA